VVVYGKVRLELIRWLDGGGSTLVRATFESPDASGARFEQLARAAANAAGSRAFRVLNGAPPTLI
jgi:hypothetical protein